MFKQIIYLITRFGEVVESKVASKYIASRQPGRWKKAGLEEQHSDDFKPELKQDFGFEDGLLHLYVDPKDRYRVYLPFRKTQLEKNTKYLNSIIDVVSKFIEPSRQNEDLRSIKFREVSPFLPDILLELSTAIHLSEHKLRYQLEQSDRHAHSNLIFNTIRYRLTTRNVADFVVSYNDYLQKSIKDSHGGINHKIPYNVLGNYHEDTTPADGLIISLKHDECKAKKFVGEVLESAYKSPDLHNRH